VTLSPSVSRDDELDRADVFGAVDVVIRCDSDGGGETTESWRAGISTEDATGKVGAEGTELAGDEMPSNSRGSTRD